MAQQAADAPVLCLGCSSLQTYKCRTVLPVRTGCMLAGGALPGMATL